VQRLSHGLTLVTRALADRCCATIAVEDPGHPNWREQIEWAAPGAKAADIGCGHGASTALMARAYPNSSFTGSDYC